MRCGPVCGVVGMLTLAGCSGTAPRADTAASSTGSGALEANATVERVVDGDTLVVDVDGGGEERVRLIGVDTPESVKPDTPVECFGKEASAFTVSLLPEGTRVRLERDVEARDDYDRLLAYVYRADDGLYVNLALVEEGYAQPLTIPPNVTDADRFVRAAREAEASDRGLWSACGG